jgi:hypothetical protein
MSKRPKYPMVESRLVTSKNEIEQELGRGVRDPARRRYLTERLLQLDHEISAVMGFTSEEVQKNEFDYFSKEAKVQKQSLIMPTAWVASEKNQNQNKAN